MPELEKPETGKHFYMKWVPTDWLGAEITALSPAARGILFDWLNHMHLLDRCGQIVGTREQLAQLGRCISLPLIDAVLQEVKSTNAADVTECNGLVTVTNRRMRREWTERKQGAQRTAEHRAKSTEGRAPQVPNNSGTPVTRPSEKGTVTPRLQKCNGDVTPHSYSQSQSYSYSEKEIESQLSQIMGKVGEDLTKLILNKSQCARLAKGILTNKTGCFYDNCKVKPEEIDARALQTVLEKIAEQTPNITVTKVLQAWNEAVTRTHQAAVDGLIKTTVPGYCMETFRELLKV